MRNLNTNKSTKKSNKNEMEVYVAKFCENNVKLYENEFKNSNINASFGSIKFDISECEVTENRIIKANALFSGVNITVPKNVNIKVKSTNIFGGTNNNTQNVNKEGINTIYIDTFTLFGGINIK